MGEYAIRKSDGVEVKIGTCEDMYYLRFEDRDKVIYSDWDGCRFRLPFPDEDDCRCPESLAIQRATPERWWVPVPSY